MLKICYKEKQNPKHSSYPKAERTKTESMFTSSYKIYMFLYFSLKYKKKAQRKS